MKKLHIPVMWTVCVYLSVTLANADPAEFVIHLEPDPEFNSTLYEGWDGGETDPGGVVYHDGEFHMFYNGMVKAFSEYSTGYAKSADGERWKRISKEPILTLADTGFEGKNIASNSVVVLEDGTWALYLTVTPSVRKYMGYIIRATASNPLGPWTIHPESVLLPGGENEWDGISVGHASVNQTDSGFTMHYVGLGSEPVDGFVEDHARIGMAVSSDGINWEKFNDPETDSALYLGSDPVMAVDTTPGTWEKWNLHDANVEFDGEQWTMAYRSYGSMDLGNIGFASSADGISWQRYAENPIATTRMIGESGIWFTNYVRHDGKDFIWFEAGWINTTRTYLITRDPGS